MEGRVHVPGRPRRRESSRGEQLQREGGARTIHTMDFSTQSYEKSYLTLTS